ncbi:hypothetical protein HELRODRAFT_190557 [Helobdella robusta]|uniref:Cell division cycle protein 27 homolog n=1 Tax=Helobdella robusta TaxID=6412 RepID=T1FS31_HELRO|nr:hypothetical protein HELRODRAFT_190557 [Helobdella robusta]ESO09568.1 hypothetical protein HELRODRAFT_190557 [Helobdella robusta]
MVVLEPVKAAIVQCLNLYNYADAAFLSERLYAEVANAEALYLLGSCYYHMKKPWKVYMLLSSHRSKSPDCRYLFAKSCFDLEKYSEAELAILETNFDFGTRNLDMVITDFGENASFALSLLGHIYHKTERKSQAIECFQASLKLNPFLWSSFEMLCELGDLTDPKQIFKVTSQNFASMCNSTSHNLSNASLTDHMTSLTQFSAIKLEDTFSTSQKDIFSHTNIATPDNTQSNITPDPDYSLLALPSAPRAKRGSLYIHHKDVSTNLVGMSPLTPSFGIMPLDLTPIPLSQNLNTVLASMASPLPISLKSSGPKSSTTAAPLVSMHGAIKPPVFSQSGNTNLPKDVTSNTALLGCPSHTIGLRRSSRLFNHTSSSVKENNKNQASIENRSSTNRAGIGGKRTKSKLTWTPQQMNERNRIESGLIQSSTGNGKSSSATTLSTTVCTATNAAQQQHVAEMQRQSANGLMLLLQDLASAYQTLSQYKCAQAIDIFENLPGQHMNTGWVLCQIGRAYFELCDYKKAEKVYAKVRELEPYRMEGMEIYSTVLWHLQLEVDLSALAQDLTDIDKLSPEAWCSTGNCFSLQKEHDVAIKFFQRAMQVDPNFTYAYTLLGHEYALIEELDKAMAAFDNAIRINPRHYNAWYGIGMVYYKQEKFSLAGLYFEKALAINPRSSALLCHVGVVQHALKKSNAALRTLDYAISIEPKNPLCKFHKASVLFANERHAEALKELDELKQIVPKESLVYFLIGKIHRKMGNMHLALINFSWAMDLDPKGTNNHIKETINKRYMMDEEDSRTSPTTPNDMDDSVMQRSLDAAMPRINDYESDEY